MNDYAKLFNPYKFVETDKSPKQKPQYHAITYFLPVLKLLYLLSK